MVKFIKSLSFRVKLVSVLVAAIVVVLGIILLRGGGISPAEAMARAGIDPPESVRVPLLQEAAWTPSAGADGFAEVLSNDKYTLLIDPATTQIAVVDKSSGYRWASNPTSDKIQEETVKGQLLTNLQSPFILTFVKTEGNDQTIRNVTNALDPKMSKEMVRSDNKLQVTYYMENNQIGFAIQYELTEHGLKARIPSDGIREEALYKVFSIDVLPYFGATKDEDGYIFVPDGPGGLVKFGEMRAGISRGYNHQVYGLELTNAGNWSRSGERREDIAYPVFGMKRGDQAYIAILTEGADSSNISAYSPGLKSSLYNISSSQIYREEYLYRMSRMATPIKAIQKKRLETDRVVEYRFLRGDEADYVGMAKAYREYLEQEGRLGERLAPVEHVPLNVKLMGGNYETAFNSIRYTAATTFNQAKEIVDRLKGRGIHDMRVTYYGWQNKGDYNLYKRFPIESKLGGEEAAKSFVSAMKDYNIDVYFEEDFVWINEKESTLTGKNNGIRGIDGTVFVDEGWFISKPERTVAMAYETIDRLKEIGVSGLLYNYVGEMVFNDYDPSGIGTRDHTITVYQGLLDYTKKTLGAAGVYQGNDYTIGHADFVTMLPYDSSYDFMVDETVPFYPIVLHGYTEYTFGDGNLRNNVEQEFLKAIEYGALPSFFLTYDDSRSLRYTPSRYLYSSQYEKWLDWIQKEYESFDSLSSVYSQRIVDHEKLSDERFVTTYEDGTKVIVDYGRNTFHVEKGEGA
ncbi:hypothetical protein EBB07_07755 [Paenibacillaceae bacterium]|nr:hypothetical protein EBB07_07755 [Paenibacillaceae bacterium]